MGCNICGYSGGFQHSGEAANLRESLICPSCFSISRDRMLVYALGLALGRRPPLRDWEPDPAFRIFETAGYRGYPQFLAAKFDYYNTKFDPAKLAEGADPRHFADIQSMPYPSDFFDCCLSADVFEHVRLDEQGFHEVFRVLKPGGIFVLQLFPYDHSIKTRILVQPAGDKDIFLESPQYHAEQTLVYRNYGSDLLDRLHACGFSVCRLHTAVPEHGISLQDTFVMRKGGYLDFIEVGSGMGFTGERVTPGRVEADLWNEHLARYIFAEGFVARKRVLDAGCGSGYGAARLAAKAKYVVGVDHSAEALGYAREHYQSRNLCFLYGDCERLPVADRQFDAVVAFEVIEHLAHPEDFLREVRRVLRPAGVLLISTPNRVYCSEERQRVNPFHQRQYSREELRSELGRFFAHVGLLAENHVASVVVAPLDGPGAPAETVLEGAPRPDDEPSFFLGVCSAEPIKIMGTALCYVPATANLLRERERLIQLRTQDIANLKKIEDDLRAEVGRLQKEFDERSAWTLRLDRELKEREQTLGALQKEYDERTAWALRLEKESKERELALGKLQAEYDERTAWALELDRELKQREQTLAKLQGEFEERTAWALKLDSELKATQEELRRTQEQISQIKETRAYRLAKFLRLV